MNRFLLGVGFFVSSAAVVAQASASDWIEDPNGRLCSMDTSTTIKLFLKKQARVVVRGVAKSASAQMPDRDRVLILRVDGNECGRAVSKSLAAGGCIVDLNKGQHTVRLDPASDGDIGLVRYQLCVEPVTMR